MWTERFRGSFSFRVFKSFSISILILLAVFTLFFIYYQKGRVKGDLIKEGRMLSVLLAHNTKTAVFAENKTLLRDDAQAVLQQDNVAAVQILNANKEILVSEEKGTFKGSRAELSLPDAGGELPELSESNDGINIVSPVRITVYNSPAELLYFESVAPSGSKKVIGFVRVVMDKGALGSETARILTRSAFIAIIFIILGAFMMIFAIRRVTRPLTRLTGEVTAFGKGESVGKVPVETDDEVGKLAAAFNTMSANLKAREEEKRSLEEKLRLAQTMEAIGTLARGVAHDFNNILSTVQGSVYILEKKLYEDSPLIDYTERINVSLAKAKSLIQSLLTFSRTQTMSLHATEINTLIRKMKPLLTTMLGEKIHLDVPLTKGEMFIMADPVQIEQVIMNLCINARDAMPYGGSLVIESESILIEDKEQTSEEGVGRGKHVCIVISDSGIGMDEDTREHIFEPFFTTKKNGRVNGLGLSIVYEIVEKHGGLIDVYTKPGEGTRFRICFPMAGQEIAESGQETNFPGVN